GTIGQIMAEAGSKKVIGIELIEEAVVAANENAKRNHLENCTFLAGDVLKMVDELKERPDLIIVDPPRDGIHPKAIGKIIAFGAPEIVYVSCKPTSLARDLEIFQQEGYQVERVKLMDMFPRTVHVETVVLLSQQKPDDTIEIDLDLDELDATSAELKATYQEIKDYVLKESGLKVSSLYISQVKRKCGIEVGENYNLPKSENARVPQCPKEKEEAIKAALKYFAMI
ncbi:class I SAM-dependent RNA methyltransferase, partial [Anaerostipes sp.]|uniref:class I SAM-dependent RNA methyltransferase n=1 Tax=Anaerostipes sp. TaxID=1872530 RepID=UPI002585DA34